MTSFCHVGFVCMLRES